MLAEGPIPGVTYLPRYGGNGEGWRIEAPIKHLNGLGRLGGLGDANDPAAVTLWGVMNGSAYKTLKSQENQLMSQGAQIQSMLGNASAEDTAILNQAWSMNQQAKNDWGTAAAAYNKVVELINTYTDAYNIPYHPSSLSGMGIVGEVEIPAIVYTVLALAGVAAAIYALIQAASNIGPAIAAVNNLVTQVGGTSQTLLNRIPDIFQSGSDAITKVAVVAGVGFVGYMVFKALQKKGHI